MNKQMRGDIQRIKSGLKDGLRHRILNDIGSAISMELLDQAHLVMPPPTGRYDFGDKIGLKYVFVGMASERDQVKARETMQRSGNASEMGQMLRKLHLKGGSDKD